MSLSVAEMISALTHRIQSLCRDEVKAFRSQVNALASWDILPGIVEGAATVMARKPSCLNPGVSVGVVAFLQQPNTGGSVLMVSVAMQLDPARVASGVYWEEADAWAHAVAGEQWAGVESKGGQESMGGRVFHYVLT